MSNLARLPDAHAFAGRKLPGPLPASYLYRCLGCGLKFRHPVLRDSEYDALYNNDQTASWPESSRDRRDWSLVAEYIARNAADGAAVLDFGCYTGGLLGRLEPHLRRAGVEINEKARVIAAKKTGAELFASLQSLPPGRRFAFVVAVDVVEHFADPGQVIASLLRVTEDGGALIITTGDADNRLWRIAGGDWWYSFYPEHLAFISERWVRGWLSRSGSGDQLVAVRRFRHLGLPLPRYLGEAFKTLLYLLAPKQYLGIVRRLKRAGGREEGAYPPGTGLTSDHVFLVIEKAERQK